MKWTWLALIGAVVMSPLRMQVTTLRGTTAIAIQQDAKSGPLISLASLAKAIGGSVIRSGDSTTFVTASATFKFMTGSTLVFDGRKLTSLPAAPVIRNDSSFVPLSFVAILLADPVRQAWQWNQRTAVLTEGRPSATLALAGGTPRHHKVTIDPGHGGEDSGNRGFAGNIWEKDVTLAVGLKLRDELRKRGVDVVMTRTRDTLINLNHRATRFCAANCDLFVSLHVNSLEKTTRNYAATNGFETFFLSAAKTEEEAWVERRENSSTQFETETVATSGFKDLDFTLRDLQGNVYLRQSAKFAAMVQEQMQLTRTSINRGVKQANFAVLRTANAPAVLVEMGFSTNRGDAQQMTTPIGQQALAESIANAIVKFLDAADRADEGGSPP